MAEDSRTSGQWWVTGGESVTLSYSTLRQAAISAFRELGADEPDAAFIADIYLDKALQGDHERGVAMLCARIRFARAGNRDFTLKAKVLSDRKATALVGGDARAEPQLLCRDAMALAIGKAREYGVACVTVQARAEMLTPFIRQALDAGMVASVMTQSIPVVAPHGGTAPLLGNAPVGWGIPGREGAIIVDMSLTQTSLKGVALAARLGEDVPAGFVRDSKGRPTNDPRALFDEAWWEQGKLVAAGSLEPIGGSHKSYAMIFVVGLLSAVLTGTDFSWDLGNDSDPPGRFGTIFTVIDPAAFGEMSVFLGRVEDYVDRLRSSPPAEEGGAILYPGERSQALQRERKAADRITLPRAHYEEFLALTGMT